MADIVPALSDMATWAPQSPLPRPRQAPSHGFATNTFIMAVRDRESGRLSWVRYTQDN
jgi:hypothetical protein